MEGQKVTKKQSTSEIKLTHRDALKAQAGQLGSAVALSIMEAHDEHVRAAQDANMQAQRAALLR